MSLRRTRGSSSLSPDATFLFGTAKRADAIRTYVAKREPVVDSRGIDGGRAVGSSVELSFVREAREALVQALLSRPRFRVVVQGLVEPEGFELEETTTWHRRRPLAPVSHFCVEHHAVVHMWERASASAETRVESFAAAVAAAPGSKRQCRTWSGRSGQ